MHAILRTAVIGFVLTTAAIPAATAQTPGSPQWDPWTGCWRPVSDRGPAATNTQPTVCVTAVPGGARLTTTVSGKPALEQTILTDGAEHPVNEAGCMGTQRHEWSAGGLRLFSRAELTCAGDPAPRRVSGYALLLGDGSWLDVQAVEVNLRDTVRVRRYVAVDAVTATRVQPGRSLGVDDVKEAASRVSSAALEAAVVESGDTIPLSGRILLDLEKARVPERVIDLMVAVAYPGKFVVERSARADRGMLPPLYISDPFAFGMFGSPMWGSSLWLDDYYPYFYSPFAYSYYGRYNPWFYQPGYIWVEGGVGGVPGGGGGGEGQPVPSGTARAVDGRGYTQVRPRDAVPEPRPSGARQVSSDASSSSSSGSSSSSSSSGTASSSGFSSGGGGDGGRTAVPR